MKPTAERVRELLDYNPLTGVFLWRYRQGVNQGWNTKNAGKIAGSPHCQGYIAIAINREKYLAHHLAWVHVKGEWPDQFVDHKNLDKTDNRIENLRLASFAESSANISIRKNSNSGHRGVWWRANRSRWVATITKDKTTYTIGSFREKQAAADAYAEKARELYGDFCPEYLREVA